ncbi:MAG: ABC transporter ATP-binding protein [Chloroflexia bacterium]
MDDTGLYRPLLLRAIGITKTFAELAALDGIDFEIPRHAIVSIIGPNGAGKTVFFNILSGVYKPSGGEIWFNGGPITGLPPDRVAALGITRTFQNTRLFGNMTVLDNVLVGEHSRLHASLWATLTHSPIALTEEADARTRARDLLGSVGLGGDETRLAKNLSFGDQRRLEIARALAADPKLLMLDEPTAGMNPQETVAMMDLIKRLQHELGLTVLLIEHDMKVVMRISERVTVLNYGVKIAEGTPDEVRNDPRVVEAYLGRAQTARNLYSGAGNGLT